MFLVFFFFKFIIILYIVIIAVIISLSLLIWLLLLLLYFPGRRGILTGSSGLTIAYLSGMEGPESNTTFQQRDIEALRQPLMADSHFRGVDVLLTSQWPNGVEKYGIPVVSVAIWGLIQ